MDRLWAPWRLSYTATLKAPTEHDPCFICRGLAENNDRENLLVLRGDRCVVYANRFPYTNGHLLICPTAHKGHLDELDTEEIFETQQTLTRMIGVLEDMMKPDGFNIGLNLGKAAGAGVPGHLHWHIVPRWNGDINFMPVLADTKVIVQSLEAFYTLLTERLRTV